MPMRMLLLRIDVIHLDCFGTVENSKPVLDRVCDEDSLIFND